MDIKPNLDFDLMRSDSIIEKCKNKIYAQHLYAALCNNQFVKNEVFPILKEEAWSCSWRYAGGVIADMQERGDYLNWYCSGITNVTYDNVADESAFRKKQFVPEGQVTDEVKNDLFKLGWLVVEDNDQE